MMGITRAEIEHILRDSLKELFNRDSDLLKHDVSERAITHKLAQYLQDRISHLHVDCEYNRNSVVGRYAPKKITILNQETEKKIRQLLDEGVTDVRIEDLVTISTFPDIIVHRRTCNDKNLLVVEVKKRNSQVDHEHDFEKLRAFTEDSEHNSYHFSYGVFVLLNTGIDWTSIEPELRWFVEGKEEI